MRKIVLFATTLMITVSNLPLYGQEMPAKALVRADTIVGFDPQTDSILREALQLLETIINTPEFRDSVLKVDFIS